MSTHNILLYFTLIYYTFYKSSKLFLLLFLYIFYRLIRSALEKSHLMFGLAITLLESRPFRLIKPMWIDHLL